MRHLINAYDILGVPLIQLRGRGWHGARRDVHSVEEAAEVLEQHHTAAMDALLLVNAEPAGARWLSLEIIRELGGGFALEVGNEWDEGEQPLYARAVWEEVAKAAAPAGVTIVTGGISTLSSTALSWLRAALSRPPWCPGLVCGFHAYTSAQLNEGNRRSELTQLRQIIGARPAWNTETGWHMANKDRPWPFCRWKQPGTALTEEQVLANLVADARIHSEYGVEVYTTYQLRDGAQDKAEDRFGIIAQDGRWKLQSELPQRLT